jgi:hypothetical protein
MVKTHVLSDKDKGMNAKLVPRYEDPYVVTAFPSPVITTLENTDTKETRQAYIGDLKHYTPREETLFDELLAMRRPRRRPGKASKEASAELPPSSHPPTPP